MPPAPQPGPAPAQPAPPAAQPAPAAPDTPGAAPNTPAAAEPAPAEPAPATTPNTPVPANSPGAAQPAPVTAPSTSGPALAADAAATTPAANGPTTAGVTTPAPTKSSPAGASTSAANAASADGAVPAEQSGYFRVVPRQFVLSGLVQAQYEASQLSEDQLLQGEPLNADRFLVRRGRVRFDQGFEFSALTLELDANTVNGPKVGIRRAEAALVWRATDLAAPPLGMFSVGVMDIPFGAELAESPRQRVFMERSLGSRATFPDEAELGAKFSGAIGGFAYALALVNGESLGALGSGGDSNAAKDVLGRVGVRVGTPRTFVVEAGASLGLGTGFHPGRPATKDAIIWLDENNDGVAQPSELRGVSGSAATASDNFERSIFGLDARLTLHTPLGRSELGAEAFVARNYDRGLLVADPVDVGFDVRQSGAAFGLTQQITRWSVLGFRGAVYDPNSDLFEQRKGEIQPLTQRIWTLSPVIGATLPRTRLLFQYDFIRDELARDVKGVPTDAKNDGWTLRLEVQL